MKDIETTLYIGLAAAVKHVVELNRHSISMSLGYICDCISFFALSFSHAFSLSGFASLKEHLFSTML